MSQLGSKAMPARFESIKNLTEAGRNITIAGAVLVGGMWTYHTFNAELHVENARANLKKLELDAQAAASVNVELEVRVLGSSGASSRYVELVAHLENAPMPVVQVVTGRRVAPSA